MKNTINYYSLLVFILVGSFEFCFAKSDRLINDSLVSNLSCNNISVEKIYSSIKTDSFDLAKHIPVRNWGFKNGPYSLGVCWSLSHTQRLFFYLAQWVKPNIPPYLDILNLIRGSKPMRGNLVDIRESALKEYYTFEIDSFSAEKGTFADLLNGIWDPLNDFFLSPDPNLFSPTQFEHGSLLRNFKTEIERYQIWRFHRFENSKLATDPVPRPRFVNLQLAKLIQSNLDKNRLPLVDIKPNMFSQHVVMIKKYSLEGNLIKFFVYDSNMPKTENFFTFNTKSQQFKAPEIIRKFPGVIYPTQDISVYLVDDEDHIKIGEALFQYYTSICDNEL